MTVFQRADFDRAGVYRLSGASREARLQGASRACNLSCKALNCNWHEQPCSVDHHLQASATVLNKLKEREEAKHKAAKLKNELESYIINIRSKVCYSPCRMSLSDLLVA